MLPTPPPVATFPILMATPLSQLTAALADRYRLERELGQGGMATVYLAEDLKHRRRVALKALKSELAAVLGAERFLREIATTANLRHPRTHRLRRAGSSSPFPRSAAVTMILGC
jgi:eukaryotic-like serine/threonine-protein kinase